MFNFKCNVNKKERTLKCFILDLLDNFLNLPFKFSELSQFYFNFHSVASGHSQRRQREEISSQLQQDINNIEKSVNTLR